MSIPRGFEKPEVTSSYCSTVTASGGFFAPPGSNVPGVPKKGETGAIFRDLDSWGGKSEQLLSLLIGCWKLLVDVGCLLFLLESRWLIRCQVISIFSLFCQVSMKVPWRFDLWHFSGMACHPSGSSARPRWVPHTDLECASMTHWLERKPFKKHRGCLNPWKKSLTVMRSDILTSNHFYIHHTKCYLP